MNEIGVVNEFFEVQDDSSILNSSKALVTSWNEPITDPPPSSRVDLLHLTMTQRYWNFFLSL